MKKYFMTILFTGLMAVTGCSGSGSDDGSASNPISENPNTDTKVITELAITASTLTPTAGETLTVNYAIPTGDTKQYRHRVASSSENRTGKIVMDGSFTANQLTISGPLPAAKEFDLKFTASGDIYTVVVSLTEQGSDTVVIEETFVFTVQ